MGKKVLVPGNRWQGGSNCEYQQEHVVFLFHDLTTAGDTIIHGRFGPISRAQRESLPGNFDFTENGLERAYGGMFATATEPVTFSFEAIKFNNFAQMRWREDDEDEDEEVESSDSS